MIEVQVPKDVSVYESPLIGPLTSRQAICVAVAAAVEYVYYTIINSLNITLEMNSLICIGMLLAAPILYLAVGKPYGMRAETYIYYFLLPSLIAPKNRPYETVLTYDVMLDEIESIKEAEVLKKNGNKKPQKKETAKKKKPKRARGKQDIMYA